MDYRKKYSSWIESEYVSEAIKDELLSISDESDIEDRFYKDLEFGTGGLRGKMGAGSNRMNFITVSKATQGLSDYLNNKYKDQECAVCIAYDSRNNSEAFSRDAACNLAANGIKVYLFESLRPTPELSFTVKYLNAQAGIVLTASHNPKEYNGYKVYNEYGGQLTDDDAKEVISYVKKVEDFESIKTMDFNKAIEEGRIVLVGEEVDKAYIEKIKALTIRKNLVKDSAKDLNIIFTPIHGSGNLPIRRALGELGYENLTVVKEQELPDGNFPTASYPNPEEPAVFELALQKAKETNPDIIFGTDPDCDRIGLVVKNNEGEYKVLNGNQTGVLLGNYIVTSLIEQGKLPEKPVILKTIVTSSMIERVCEKYDVETMDVLTGFKYIGEKIYQFEEEENKNFVFGFEESFGYLLGDFVKDKDAVAAAVIVCEMALYYKKKGMSLYEALTELYKEYGYYREDLISILLEGKEGTEQIGRALEYLRHSMPTAINGAKIIKKQDYKLSVEKDLRNITETKIELPKSNVLKFTLEDNSWFVVRPSGTEPKMKIYISVCGKNDDESLNKITEFKKSVMALINEACGK